MKRALSIFAVFGLLVAAPLGLHAQSPPPAASMDRSHIFMGGGLMVAQPEGEFRDYVSQGFGAGGHFLFRLHSRSALGLRLDATFLNYGRETKRVALSPTIGERILVDVTTDNNIGIFGIGPQLVLPDGRLRPYVNATLGASYFFTQSQVEGTQENRPFAQTTNFDDLTFSYGGGTGLYIPIVRGATTVSLDLGARYVINGQTRYLREGGIIDGPGGSISVTPIESETNFFTVHIGASVAVRPPSEPAPPRRGVGRHR
jgi:hypothetical protein